MDHLLSRELAFARKCKCTFVDITFRVITKNTRIEFSVAGTCSQVFSPQSIGWVCILPTGQKHSRLEQWSEGFLSKISTKRVISNSYRSERYSLLHPPFNEIKC